MYIKRSCKFLHSPGPQAQVIKKFYDYWDNPRNTTYEHFADVHKDFTTLSHQWLPQEERQKIFNKLVKMG